MGLTPFFCGKSLWVIILWCMKFVFVVGGSYKSFYLNQINKIRNIDLMIFNQNIFYDFDYEKEQTYNGPITQELIYLNQKLNCPIVVYGVLNKCNIKSRCFILCNNQKIKIIDANKDVYLVVKGRFVLIGNRVYNRSNAFATISMTEDQNCMVFEKIYLNNYFMCDKKCVTLLNKGKICRKFQKCCKFILKKNK